MFSSGGNLHFKKYKVSLRPEKGVNSPTGGPGPGSAPCPEPWGFNKQSHCIAGAQHYFTERNTAAHNPAVRGPAIRCTKSGGFLHPCGAVIKGGGRAGLGFVQTICQNRSLRTHTAKECECNWMYCFM